MTPLTTWKTLASRDCFHAALMGVLLSTLLLSGCDDPRERRCRKAVRALASAGTLTQQRALDDVVEFGRFALVDIEQELHGAALAARLRLLEAVEKIGDKEALPLLRFYQRWDPDELVRKKAKAAIATLESK
jgi:HEAT repeat protein